MTETAQGNLLTADAEALVNTVNCVGVMGKGIALQFKQAYPAMAKAYEQACERGEVRPGHMHVWETGELQGPRYIINFPTKRHWRGQSSYQDVADGLAALIDEVKRRGITSIAVPPLGCGNGGLSWTTVRPMIEEAFAQVPDVRALVYGPSDAAVPITRTINTVRPKLTRARALFIGAIERYAVLSYEITLLEVQKLAYFLQEAGEPLRLKINKGIYGPYADNLNKVLETLEGHYIHGYDGERAPEKQISLDDAAPAEAWTFLEREADAAARLKRVGQLIEGFETPYGMELLSSVHYVAKHGMPSATTAEEAIGRVHEWNPRKAKLLQAEHIRIAWSHLQQQGWLT
jgi:O-acetyl-ADP-ribose deacetylase (regulator of RNase III)